MKIEHMQIIVREYVRVNPHKVFLFGDNLIQRGLGGQAKEMRGEPNAVGIPTKKLPSWKPEAFFTDDEYESNIAAISDASHRAVDLAIDLAIRHQCPATIVIPSAGLGTYRARMREVAPRTYKYLQMRLKHMEDYL